MSRLTKLFIIGVFLIIASEIALLPPSGSVGPSKRETALVRVQNFKFALAMFKIDNNRYPTQGEGLDALIKRPVAIPENGKWIGYLGMDKLPLDPWGRPYIYEIPGKHNMDSFDVYSLGPNGKGGDEAIGNWMPRP